MRKLVFSMNVSLDGFADHEVALADDELHDFATDLLDTQEMVLFGRVTYQLFESYWPVAPEDPQATKSMVEFSRKINAMPKIVFSNTIPGASWNNTRLVRGDAVEEVKRLKEEDGKSLAVGGISLIQSCMNLGLIDEYWLLVQPLLWGKGKRLFAGVMGRHGQRLLEMTTFRSGVVILHYMLENN
jgi:dihydrofolate reductase